MDLTHDWESCMTLVGGQWSWKPGGAMYSFEDTLKMLLDCTTGGGNLLLNIGPMPTGEIEPRQVARLQQVGDWLKRHGAAVYGTRGGPFPNGVWGGSTHRDNHVYVHVFKWQGDALRAPAVAAKDHRREAFARRREVGLYPKRKGHHRYRARCAARTGGHRDQADAGSQVRRSGQLRGGDCVVGWVEWSEPHHDMLGQWWGSLHSTRPNGF